MTGTLHVLGTGDDGEEGLNMPVRKEAETRKSRGSFFSAVAGLGKLLPVAPVTSPATSFEARPAGPAEPAAGSFILAVSSISLFFLFSRPEVIYLPFFQAVLKLSKKGLRRVL